MIVDISKSYTTAGGCPVRIYAISGPFGYEVHGAVHLANVWVPREWTISGVFTGPSRSGVNNLVEAVVERKEGEGL